jgi:glycosyltransferase involved in cell wall biosynthesis
MKPVLFVTGHAPAYRVGALARLHEREQIELALFGGSSKHGGAEHAGELPFPNRRVTPRALHGLAASGKYRAVVCPTGGRMAPLTTWSGARRAGAPLILWASLWAHPRTAAHAFTYLPLRRLYRSADAVVTYGEHVSAYVRAQGATNVYVAPQSVDNDFWRAAHRTPAPTGHTRFLFVGRAAPEKGLDVLLAAWRLAGFDPEFTTLTIAGAGPSDGGGTLGVTVLPRQSAEQLRELYWSTDALIVPSIQTRNFREPWGLVVNEAMNASLAVVVSDAVGAAAGGLVVDGENGFLVRAADPPALAGALARLQADPPLRARLGARGSHDVLAHSPEAWADGFSQALGSLGLARGRW